MESTAEEHAAVTSHELRTPLTSIEGYAKTLLQPAFADDRDAREEFVSTVERQAGRLGGMIENILAATQLNASGRDRGEASIPDGVRSVLARQPEARPSRRRGRLSRSATGSSRPPPAWADARRSDRQRPEVLTPPGSPSRVRAHEEDGRVTISVQDEGLGIADEHSARIFDRFFRVDSSSTRRHGGIGLGLHLVKTIVTGLAERSMSKASWG